LRPEGSAADAPPVSRAVKVGGAGGATPPRAAGGAA
jgi:hypothetical protein